MDQDREKLIDLAVAGDRDALEALLTQAQDMVFHLSLRMLGTVPDAEDAAQEILIKIMTRLSTFRRECAYSTWVYRIAVNHLKSYKKGMFARRPLSFEYYGEDIRCGREGDMPDLSQGVDRALLAEELKYSCTNVMLQCLDREERCIFILGAMFRADSRVAGEILDMTPEAYRQWLSRIRRRVGDFLGEYCGHAGGSCSRARRVDYAAATHRLDPRNLEYVRLERTEEYKQAMERLDELSLLFDSLPGYRATPRSRRFLEELLRSGEMDVVRNT